MQVQGITVTGVTYTGGDEESPGDHGSSGTFINGPLGLGTGAVFTNGLAKQG